METAFSNLLALFLAAPVPLQEPLQVPPAAASARQALDTSTADYAVHEWGTFTSVLDSTGKNLTWNPFQFFAPLPGFVYGSRGRVKLEASGTVRMETPVLYFYAANELTVDVRVDFPAGELTEWYPAAEALESGLRWRATRVRPGFEPALATTLGGEHYYAARGVAAATVESGGEAEKFLFYRGVGSFDQPLAVRILGAGAERAFELENRGAEPIDRVLLFENVDGECAFAEVGALAPLGVRRLRRDAFAFSPEPSLAPLEELLRAHGLFADEARAMLATWRRDWFEPGLRAFYVLPRPATERLLPLTLSPAPRALERVLVGRLELFEPELEAEILAAARALATNARTAEEAFAPLGQRLTRFGLALLQARAESDPETAGAQWALVQWLQAH